VDLVHVFGLAKTLCKLLQKKVFNLAAAEEKTK
jgi:hypothetical protein